MAVQDYDVVAIGNAVVDVIARCDDAFLEPLGVPKGSMRFVDRSGSIAQLITKLPRVTDVAGGSAANTTVGVASLGGRSAFIGMVAEDSYGRSFGHDIRGAGVTFSSTATCAAGKETSHSLILVTPDGRRTMNTFLGCSADISESLIDAPTIKSGRIIYIEGYLFDYPNAVDACKHAIALARASGRLVALSLADASCVDRNRNEFMAVIQSSVGLLIANEEEMRSLYQTADLDEIIRRAGRDVALSVITRSGQGSIVVARENVFSVPAERVSKVVDATGAGDLYAAGFLFGLARGADEELAGKLGGFAAAEIIGQLGARPIANLGSLARMRGFFNGLNR